MRIKLGPCPSCGKDLHIFDSLIIDDFKRWEFDCKTRDCIFQFREFNYDRKDDIERVYKKNIDLSKTITLKGRTYEHVKIEPVGKPKKQEIKVHYSKSGKLSGVKCSSGKFAKDCTKDIKKVNCYHCTFTGGYKLAKSKTVRGSNVL